MNEKERKKMIKDREKILNRINRVEKIVHRISNEHNILGFDYIRKDVHLPSATFFEFFDKYRVELFSFDYPYKLTARYKDVTYFTLITKKEAIEHGIQI